MVKRTKIAAIVASVVVGLLLVMGVVWGVFTSPKYVRVSNITAKSATISWVSKMPSVGYAVASTDPNMSASKMKKEGFVAYDDRDWSKAELATSSGGDGNASVVSDDMVLKVLRKSHYKTHHVSFRGLKENTKYYFYVCNDLRCVKVSEKNNSQDDEGLIVAKDNTFSTLAIEEEPRAPYPIYGSVYRWRDEEDTLPPAKDAIVYIVVDTGSIQSGLYSATVNEKGGFTFDASFMRDTDGNLMNIAKISKDSTVYTLGKTAVGFVESSTTVGNVTPIPPMYVGNVGGSKNEKSANSLVSVVYGRYTRQPLPPSEIEGDNDSTQGASGEQSGNNGVFERQQRTFGGGSYTQGGAQESDEHVASSNIYQRRVGTYRSRYGNRTTTSDSGNGADSSVGQRLSREGNSRGSSQSAGQVNNTESTEGEATSGGSHNPVGDNNMGPFKDNVCEKISVAPKFENPERTGWCKCRATKVSRIKIVCEGVAGARFEEKGREVVHTAYAVCGWKPEQCPTDKTKQPIAPEEHKVVSVSSVETEIATANDIVRQEQEYEERNDNNPNASKVSVSVGDLCNSNSGCICGSGTKKTSQGVVYILVGGTAKKGQTCGHKYISKIEGDFACSADVLGDAASDVVPCTNNTYCAAASGLDACVEPTPMDEMEQEVSFVPSAYAQSSVNVTTDGDYVVYFPEDGVYDVNIGDKYKVTGAVAKKGNKMVFYVDTDKSGSFTKDDKLVPVAGYQIKVAKVVDTHKYQLKKGINIISFPFKPAMDKKTPLTASQLLKEVNKGTQNVKLITYFDSSKGKWVGGYRDPDGTGKGQGEDFTLTFGRGYLVIAAEDTTISVPGYNVQSEVPVAFMPGWNLVGIHGYKQHFTASSLIDSISSVNGLTADNVTRWDTSRGRYDGLQKSEGTEYGFDYPITDVLGYFVRVAKFTPTDSKSKSIIWAPGTNMNGQSGSL